MDREAVIHLDISMYGESLHTWALESFRTQDHVLLGLHDVAHAAILDDDNLDVLYTCSEAELPISS